MDNYIIKRAKLYLAIFAIFISLVAFVCSVIALLSINVNNMLYNEYSQEVRELNKKIDRRFYADIEHNGE